MNEDSRAFVAARRVMGSALGWLLIWLAGPLIGIGSDEWPGERLAARQIAGLLARRVVSWVSVSDSVARGQRLGRIQYGSRCDLYLPLSAQVTVKPGDKVVGGETVVAKRAFSEDRLDQTPAMAQSSMQV